MKTEAEDGVINKPRIVSCPQRPGERSRGQILPQSFQESQPH